MKGQIMAKTKIKNGDNTTLINNKYYFRCSLCNSVTNMKVLEEDKDFSAYELKCTKCSNVRYMFCMYLESRNELEEFLKRYRLILDNL